MSVLVRVLVVDDHEVVRRGVVEVIDADEQLEVVAEAASVEQALVRAVATTPDVAVIDLRLPDGTGVELVERLVAALPQIHCLLLTSFDDDAAARAAHVAGARAYLLKSVRGTEIAEAVRAVAAGRDLLRERSVAAPRQDDALSVLTPTERRVLDLVAEGLSNRQIGEALGLAEKTVKNHVTGVLGKMGFQRRTQAAAWLVAHRATEWR